MVRQTAKVVIVEIIGGLIVLAAVLVVILALRLASGPLQIDIFKDDVAAALSEARDGRRTTIDRLWLEWAPEQRRMLVVAHGLALYSNEGEQAATAEQAEIDLNASALFTGRLEVLRLLLSGGRLDVTEIERNVWSVAGEPLPPIPESEKFPETGAEWLDATDNALPFILSGAQSISEQLNLERVGFDAFEVRVINKDGDRLTSLSNASLRLTRQPGDLVLRLSGRLGEEDERRGLAILLETTESFAGLHAELGLVGWRLSELAFGRLETPAETDAPVRLALMASATAADGVSIVNLDGEIGAGRLRLAGLPIDLEQAAFEADYDTGLDQVAFSLRDVEADRFSGDLDGVLDGTLRGAAARTFSFESDSLRVDATPMFEAPWTLRDIAADGVLDIEARRVDVGSASVRIAEEAVLSAQGGLSLGSGEDAALRGDITAQLAGPAGLADVLAYWPVGLGTGARDFAAGNIFNAELMDASAELTLRPDSFAAGYLKDEHLQVDFTVRNVEVGFLHDLPTVQGASGQGRLTGNGFRADLEAGSFSGWQLTSGTVEFPQFMPKGEPFRIYAEGTGEAVEILRTISDSRLQLEAEMGFDPERVSGRGEATFEMFRPALSDVPFEDIRMSVKGLVRDGGMTKVAAGLDLTEARADVTFEDTSLTIRGYGDLGPAPVQFTWRDSFSDGGAPANISASAIVTPDVLNRFGVLGRAFLSGEIPVEMQGQAAGNSVAKADVAFDLSRARIDLSEIGWIKPAGERARATLSFDAQSEAREASGYLEADDMVLDGDITFAEDWQLLSADLRRAFLEDRADVSGQITRDGDGSLSVSLSGAFLDVSSAVPDVGAMGGAGSFDDPLTLDAEVDRLRLRGGLEMRTARMAMISTAEGLQSFSAAGRLESGEPFEASYQAGERGAEVSLDAGDAGFLASAFLGADFLEGGRIQLDGQLVPGSTPSEIDIRISDARMRDAPFLTQILSLASLRGLADTLGGEGVLFSRIDVPLTISDNRYIVDGGRASGPALGLTVNGYVGTEDGDIHIDGVLVPSFGLNSALGGIPIIGDLVVGRDGEGVFSLTYSVRGTLEKAQVSVNPLSAVAPGIIRRIFENPAQTDVPEFQARDPDNPIPSELEPLPPPEVID
ncbi:MAG: DUF3971 domain-containing protein [Pseudomonadota bacterium]